MPVAMGWMPARNPVERESPIAGQALAGVSLGGWKLRGCRMHARGLSRGRACSPVWPLVGGHKFDLFSHITD